MKKRAILASNPALEKWICQGETERINPDNKASFRFGVNHAMNNIKKATVPIPANTEGSLTERLLLPKKNWAVETE